MPEQTPEQMMEELERLMAQARRHRCFAPNCALAQGRVDISNCRRCRLIKALPTLLAHMKAQGEENAELRARNVRLVSQAAGLEDAALKVRVRVEAQGEELEAKREKWARRGMAQVQRAEKAEHRNREQAARIEALEGVVEAARDMLKPQGLMDTSMTSVDPFEVLKGKCAALRAALTTLENPDV